MNTEQAAEQNTELAQAWSTPRLVPAAAAPAGTAQDDEERLIVSDVEDQRRETHRSEVSELLREVGSAAARAGEGLWRRIVASPAKVSATVQWAWRKHPGRVMMAALFLVALATASAVFGIVNQGTHDSPVTSTCSEVG